MSEAVEQSGGDGELLNLKCEALVWHHSTTELRMMPSLLVFLATAKQAVSVLRKELEEGGGGGLRNEAQGPLQQPPSPPQQQQLGGEKNGAYDGASILGPGHS